MEQSKHWSQQSTMGRCRLNFDPFGRKTSYHYPLNHGGDAYIEVAPEVGKEKDGRIFTSWRTRSLKKLEY